jgi:hypothetical protein
VSPNSTLAFVVSLHLVLYALLVKPVDGGNAAEAILLGVFSFLLLAAGVVNEVFVADPS